MGTGYKRVDITNNIADGNIINAADLDNEFDGVEAAFDESTGHDHGGGADNGAPITKVGPAQDVSISTTAVTPKTDNAVDIGSTTFKFKNLYLSGSANVGSFASTSVDIDGGTIDGVTIGGSSAGAGTFTTATATTGNITTVNATTVDTTNLEVTNIKAKDGTAAATIADSTGVVSVSTQLNVDNIRIDGNAITSTNTNGNIALTPNGSGEVDISKVDIDSGTIDGTAIGGASAAAGTFTNLTATGTVTIPDNAISGDKVEGGTINATTITTLTSTTGNIGTAVVGAGTASAPSITTTGDTNTGIFFPAADTIAFAEGGVEAMRIDSSGNVGIGTASPSNLLHVSGTSGTPVLLERTNGAACVIAFKGNATTNNPYLGATTDDLYFNTGNAERMRIDSSGNVGIGVTPSAWGGGILGLQVKDSTMYAVSGVNGYFGTNAYYNTVGGSGFKYYGTGAAALYGQEAGVHKWWNAPSSTAGNAITFTRAMTLDASGNLGVGTTSPGARLNAVVSYVASTIVPSLKLATVGGYNSGSGTAIDFGQDQGTYSTWVTGRIASPRTSDWGGALTFSTNDNSGPTALVERARITSGGNLDLQKNLGLGGASATTSGTGITFPATQSASSNANTLDDYEQGVFTATVTPLTSGTITLDSGANDLFYTKIGRVVVITGLLEVASVSSPVGTMVTMGNLPFPIPTIGVDYPTRFSTGILVGNLIADSGLKALFGVEGNSTVYILVDASTVKAGSQFYILFTYHTND